MAARVATPNPLFKASDAPFLTLRVATLSGAPHQAPLDKCFEPKPRIVQSLGSKCDDDNCMTHSEKCRALVFKQYLPSVAEAFVGTICNRAGPV